MRVLAIQDLFQRTGTGVPNDYGFVRRCEQAKASWSGKKAAAGRREARTRRRQPPSIRRELEGRHGTGVAFELVRAHKLDWGFLLAFLGHHPL
jgi:hypothetical protein